MRTTLTIDDELLATAKRYAGTEHTGDVVRKGLKMLVEWEASRRLAAIGGSDPEAEAAPRRRSLAA
jgi:Arc/MetJ family transcription regulator